LGETIVEGRDLTPADTIGHPDVALVNQAGVGIYGVLSYVVSQRQQELGIRLAIGAGRAHVLVLVLKSGLVLAGTGVIVGLGIARVATRLLGPLLHDVAPYDPLTYVVVPIVLVAVAAFASLVPAWRASRVDPLRALRAQ
jgi:ABC-type antimicrobial peptide transport system permease subunit